MIMTVIEPGSKEKNLACPIPMEKTKPRRQASWYLFITVLITPIGVTRLFLLRGLLGLLGRGFLFGWHGFITVLSV